MKNKVLIIIIGESTGFECLKNILKLKYFKIFLVVSTDKNYHYAIKKLCIINKINFLKSSEFKKNSTQVKLHKNNQYFLLSIFSNLILKSNFLKKFNGKAFNLHPGLLPYYPGKNCISGVLYNNEKITGVSLHQITDEVDKGPIIKQKKIKIYKDDNLIKLMNRLKPNSVKIINNFVRNIYFKKKIIYFKNDISLRKKFPKYIPNKGIINAKTNYTEFQKLFKASHFGPFKNSWGRLCFIYQNKKKYIVDVLQIDILQVKNINSIIFIKKINKNKFNLNFRNKVVTVLTK